MIDAANKLLNQFFKFFETQFKLIHVSESKLINSNIMFASATLYTCFQHCNLKKP